MYHTVIHIQCHLDARLTLYEAMRAIQDHTIHWLARTSTLHHLYPQVIGSYIYI